MPSIESARILFQAEVPWTINFFILGPLTVIAAFIFYQLIVPGLLKWRQLKDEMTVVLTQYANYVVFVEEINGKKKLVNDALFERVNQELRKLAGEVSTIQHIFLYKLWVKLKWLPNPELIEDIRGNLIGWSNNLTERKLGDLDRVIRIESLKNNLGIENLYIQLKKSQELEWGNARRH